MKKGLFLLPLVGGFLLSGCTFNLFGQEITLFEKDEDSSTPGGTVTPSGGGGGGQSGGGGSGGGGSGGGGSGGGTVTHKDLNVQVSGTRLQWIDFHTDVSTSKSDEQAVFEHEGAKLTVDRNGAYQKVGGTGSYFSNPVRTYSGQKITVEYSTAFKTLCFDSPHYNDNAYDEQFKDSVNAGTGATAELQGAVVVITLEKETTSWELVVPKTAGAKENPQCRFYSLEIFG